MKIFAPIKSLFKFGKNPKDYKLVTRQDYTPIDKFANSYNITIPQNADTFSYVKIAKTDNEDSTKEVITIFNKQKQPISRNILKNGVFKSRQFISYFVNTKKILTEKFISFGDNSIYSKKPIGAWTSVGTKEFHILSYPLYKGKGYSVTSKYITPVKDFDAPSNKYVLIKHPDIIKKSKKAKKSGKKQFLSVILSDKYQCVELSNLKYSKDLNLDINDKFLPYRILNPKSASGVRALTEYYIKQKGLERLEIPVYTGYCEKDGSRGFFRSAKGEIGYDLDELRYDSPESFVNTVAHEVEHAWQHALAGRAGFDVDPYEKRARILLGELTDPKEIVAAEKYAEAIRIYPNMNVTSAKDPRYYENLLEVDARAAGSKAEVDYKNSQNYEIFKDIFRNQSFYY